MSFRAWLFRPVLLAIKLSKEVIMSAISDAVTRITASTQAEIAAVLAALNASPPDVAAAVTQLNALSDTLDAETAALTPPGP